MITDSVYAEQAKANLQYALPKYSQVYDDQRDPFKDAKAAISLANKTGRHVLIEVGGNWCGWCHKMDAFLLAHPDIYKMLHDNYVLLKINVSDSNENADFMKSLPPVQGYPHMYVASDQGTILLSKDTGELLENLEYSTKNWRAFLTKWQFKDKANTPNTTVKKGDNHHG